MKLIIGLGNPGKNYEHNRHNVGFVMIDELQKDFSAQGGPTSGWEFNKKFNAEISENNLGDEKTILIKPQTFMNKSGDAVRDTISFYKLTPEDIIIIHDDLDIEVGNFKISTDSSAAGHNGVQDIMDKLGTQELKRVRVGVEMEGGRENRKIPGEAFVLQDFTEEEYEKIMDRVQNIANELYSL